MEQMKSGRKGKEGEGGRWEGKGGKVEVKKGTEGKERKKG